MFYLDGFLLYQGQTQSDYSEAFMSAFPLARARPDQTVILVYRLPGGVEMVFTRIKARSDGYDADPITKRDVMKLAFLRLIEAGE